MRKITINMKQRNLLLKSAIVEEYTWLKELLIQRKSISTFDIPEYLQSEFVNVVPFIVKQSEDEWKGNEEASYPVEDMQGNRKRCSLCNTPNRYIYYIKNRLNGNKMNVGSDCIQEFIDFENLGFRKSRGQLEKEARKIRKKSIANRHIDGIDLIVENWNYEIEKYAILIPNSIRTRYLELGIKVKNEYDVFLNNDKHSILQLEKLFEKYFSLKQEIDEYQMKNRDNPFIATKSIISWLQNKNDHVTISRLREDGLLTVETVGNISERTFIKEQENNIKNLLEELELVVDLFNYFDEEIHMTLNMYNGSIEIVCSFNRFMERFGTLLLNVQPKSSLSLTNLVRISSIHRKFSKEFLVDFVSDRFRYFNKKISFKLPDNYEETDELDIVNLSTGKVFIYKLTKFIQEMKLYVIKNDENMINRDESYYMKLHGKWYSKKELQDIRDTASEMDSKKYYSNKDASELII